MVKPRSFAQKLIASHLISGDISQPNSEIQLNVDQVLLQDATGTLTMLALDAIGLNHIKVKVACQYIDHNLLQADFRNRDDHLFLQSSASRFGIHFALPGTGVSHAVHMERLGVPGQVLAGSDSHTCAAGSLGMLAFGAGSLDIASILAGQPISLKMPLIMGVRVTGQLADWVSAKDVILELLRRHTVKGGVGRIIEYFGPGLAHLSAMDRHVIANMGAEMGATTSLFPSDQRTREFLKIHGRELSYQPLNADDQAEYDFYDEIDLSSIEPLIALPSSPDNVVPVRQVLGRPVHQSYLGSSANPGYRDLAIAAHMVQGRQVDSKVSFDLNPASRQVLTDLAHEGLLADLVQSGARLHQTGCNGCMGMGQVPGTAQNSLRTTPRNFPGRSGIADDQIYLCSPETATASALTGQITDPRDLAREWKIDYPGAYLSPNDPVIGASSLIAPPENKNCKSSDIQWGPSIAKLPLIKPLADHLSVPVLLHLCHNVSTDTIIPAGAEAMPYRSNVQAISQFCFRDLNQDYPTKANALIATGGHAIVAGENFGQGSSREHAVLAPQYLGLRLVIAQSFARIYHQNLVNGGILALTLNNPDEINNLQEGELIQVEHCHAQVDAGPEIQLSITHGSRKTTFVARHSLSQRQRAIFHAGGLIHWLRSQRA